MDLQNICKYMYTHNLVLLWWESEMANLIDLWGKSNYYFVFPLSHRMLSE